MTPGPNDLMQVLPQFPLSGTLHEVRPYGSGHINRTYLSMYNDQGQLVRYIHQRINEQVFRQPEQLMENIERVSAHLQTKNPGRALRLVSAFDGRPYAIDAEGGYWRTYHYIENTRACDMIESDAQAQEIGRAIGHFQRQLADFPAPPLHETIPNFHNARLRFQAFRQAVHADPVGRAASVQPEIAWFSAQEDRTSLILKAVEAGTIPVRITHNDTKANNVLLDQNTGEAVCVIDLDTVMPGTLLYDFGDLVRTATSTALEDDPNASNMEFHPSRYRALYRGFTEEAADLLTPAERELLPEAGRTLAVIMGVRFLTDYLMGDTYYPIHRPGHNFDRARTQKALVESMDSRIGSSSYSDSTTR